MRPDGNILFKKCSRRGFGLFVVLLLIATVAKAQMAGTGAISGTVTDPTGAVIAKAMVIATAVDTNVNTTRITTTAGDYNITPLLPGVYAVTVTAAGFESISRKM